MRYSAPSAPSITRWSHDIVTVIVLPATTWPPRTTGASTTVPIARMPASGGFKIAVNRSIAYMPRFETENVEPAISCAFGSPYEGEIPVDDVVALGTRLREAGASSLTYADTTGLATRDSLGGVLEGVGKDVGLHLHDANGQEAASALLHGGASAGINNEPALGLSREAEPALPRGNAAAMR